MKAWIVAALGLAACGTTLMSQRIERAVKGWRVALLEVRDGPNRFDLHFDHGYAPEKGLRFLWVMIEVSNDSDQGRTFTYARCNLDDGERRYLPSLVAHGGRLARLADQEERYGPGEQRRRKLAYSYPKGRLPSRLDCADFAFPSRCDEASAGRDQSGGWRGGRGPRLPRPSRGDQSVPRGRICKR